MSKNHRNKMTQVWWENSFKTPDELNDLKSPTKFPSV